MYYSQLLVSIRIKYIDITIEIPQLKVGNRYGNEALEFLVSSMELITLNELRDQTSQFLVSRIVYLTLTCFWYCVKDYFITKTLFKDIEVSILVHFMYICTYFVYTLE